MERVELNSKHCVDYFDSNRCTINGTLVFECKFRILYFYFFYLKILVIFTIKFNSQEIGDKMSIVLSEIII